MRPNWRFVLAQVDGNRRIQRISTQVVSTFADGHGELVSEDLLPEDIESAAAALRQATRSDGGARDAAAELLIEAVREGNVESIARLLEAGVDVNAAARDHLTAIACAVKRGDDRVVKLLLTAGADPVGRVDGRGVLELAIAANRDEVVAQLIAAGANVNAISGESWKNSLMIAACPRRNQIVKRLLAARAYTFLNDRNGKTAAQLYEGCEEGDPFDESIHTELKD